MRIAVIDLGTNTFNILIVEVAEDKEYKTLFQTKIAVKLGEGGINNNIIQPVPFQRGINALKEYKNIIKEYKVEKVHAMATSAIRDAKNGKDFVAEVKAQTGFEVKVISGDEEAELIYHGVRHAVTMTGDRSLIIDIGGGSIEFIIANKDEIFWKQSFPVGAARIIEKFQPSDPITDGQIIAIRDFLKAEFTPLFNAVKAMHVTELIGSSGSFDSLAEMIAHRFYTIDILDNVTEYSFNFKDFGIIFESVIESTREERLKMKGLIEMRVDMIVVSMIIIQYVVWAFDIQKLRLSTYALKEGVLYGLLKED
jgi:exopolyphosphatase/guanosine-5'-triphosphate,3'-diphosphate pyrophosphatase